MRRVRKEENFSLLTHISVMMWTDLVHTGAVFIMMKPADIPVDLHVSVPPES
jgi:hypothetical protein